MIDVSRVKKLQAQIPDSDLLIEGIDLLYQAYQYALDVSRDPWEFAVGIGELRAVGMTNADCRWLLCKGLSPTCSRNSLGERGPSEIRIRESSVFPQSLLFSTHRAGGEVGRRPVR